MPIMPVNNIEEGDIITIKDYNRAWVLLYVTEEDLNNGVNAEEVGLHAFGGMWYGSDPLSIESYGKILDIERDKIVEVLDNVTHLPVKKIKELVD